MCHACAPGKYCETSGLRSATSTCPSGHWCEEGSAFPSACPVGTFAAAGGQTSSDACVACTAGHYCDSTGLSAPTAVCDEGYWCPGGAQVARPNATICPAGTACVAGSVSPVACAPGRYQPSAGSGSCLPCLAGNYCDGSVPSSYTPCTAGSYCPTGSTAPSSCRNGTFQMQAGQSSCDECDAGFYCTDADRSVKLPCPQGYWCGRGTEIPSACAAGTYGATEQLESQSNCTACPPGRHCEASATVMPRACPVGHFCPEGTSQPHTCENGTYSTVENLTAQTQCVRYLTLYWFVLYFCAFLVPGSLLLYNGHPCGTA